MGRFRVLFKVRFGAGGDDGIPILRVGVGEFGVGLRHEDLLLG